MDEFTEQHRANLVDYLAAHELPKGLGSEESACSIAAINLAISGKLTDEIPLCMSKVLGRATIRLQDVMPDEMRNSARYKTLLPPMAGTGRELEKERSAVLLDWMWTVVLPRLQPIADERGFGEKWAAMCSEKTDAAAAYAAAADADAADAAADVDAAAAAREDFWAAVDPIAALERATFIKAKAE